MFKEFSTRKIHRFITYLTGTETEVDQGRGDTWSHSPSGLDLGGNFLHLSSESVGVTSSLPKT